jgi:hypothetical protein
MALSGCLGLPSHSEGFTAPGLTGLIQISAFDRADTKSVGIFTSTRFSRMIVLGGGGLRIVDDWFETFRGASAKSCARAELAVEKLTIETNEKTITRATGKHLMIEI